MSISVITVNGQSVNLVAFPAAPGLRSVNFVLNDKVGVVTSVFTGQVQRQQWPGADMLSATLTPPKLTRKQADDWICFLMELRGMANAFQAGDPMRPTPRGSVAGTPLVDNTVLGGNAAMSQTLGLKGFTASEPGVLKRGDWLQVDYRLYKNLVDADADSSGKVTISVWPALREIPTDGGALITTNPKGLFCLAKNDRSWSADVTRLTATTINCQEYR